MSVLTNPVILSVVLMIVLCLLRSNVFVSITLSSLVCGLLGGGTLFETLEVFIAGMSSNNSLVFAMLLFGIVVEGIEYSGIGSALAPRLSALAGERKWMMLLILFLFGILAESAFMLGPTFVPIAVPPLLAYANEKKIDRRCIAAVVIGGLQLGYSCVPFGFSLAFHQIIAEAAAVNGLLIAATDIWKQVWPFALALLVGALIALILYRGPRAYTAETADTQCAEAALPALTGKHWATIFAAVTTVLVQFLTSSLPLGALIGIALLLVLRVIPWREFDRVCMQGFQSFGVVAFVLMAAAGFAAVFREYGQIDLLVDAVAGLLGGNRLLGALGMLLLGVVITVGIGSGFAAVSIISAIMMPLCVQMGFDRSTTVLLVAAAAALGDGMTPASSQTLLPTAALNLDGAHDHIRDTCVPVFVCYALPSVVVILAAAVLH